MSRKGYQKRARAEQSHSQPPAPAETNPQETHGELERLAQEYERAYAELQQLRQENRTLKAQCEQKEERCQKLNRTAYDANREARLLKQQLAKLEQQRDKAERQLNRLQGKYDALANSKLGRLTLYYWAKKNHKGVLGAVAGLSVVDRAFQNLPPAAELEGTAYLVDQPEEQRTTEQEGAAAEPAQAAVPAAESAIESRTEQGYGAVRVDQSMEGTVDRICQKISKKIDLLCAPKMSEEQENWYEQYAQRVEQIPDSTGTRFYQKLSHRIGIVCDEFFYESICDAADFVYLTPENWREALEQGLDALLFVTAWRGLHEEWKGVASISSMSFNPKRTAALELLDTCGSMGIPRIFYSKEDPPNYEIFLDFAKKCDYIFTSAKECVPYYQQDCGTQAVGAVCFGINPQFHNPIGFRRFPKEDTVLFSGSWMMKYPDRCKEISVIFDGIVQSGHGLHIIDRNYPTNKNYMFPDRYFPFVSPALPHDVLQKVHKLFDWAININSVKASETMFANRAFELQANGVLLLSNFSVGVNELLPTVQMVQDGTEVERILAGFTDEERYERQIAGVRSVMTNHTCYDRIAELLRPTGLAVEQPTRRVLVLADQVTERVQACFDRQTYPDKTLLAAADATPAALLDYDMVAWFHPAAEYGTFYLEDMANGFKYTASDYITKDAWYEGETLHPGTEHDYVSQMGSKYRTLFWRAAFAPEQLLTMDGAQALENGYSIDHFHYDAAPVERTEVERDYLLSVVVPVYNNGKHLYGKCFASLRRSTMFADMEIILVDDGSTDANTLKMEDWLAARYPNVRIFRFADGGSGSPSRPRNKGVELATAPYLTFLDPGNEAVCDGYAQLYREAVDGQYDLALGNLYKCDVETRLADYYGDILKGTGRAQFENGFGDGLKQVNFLSTSIQAMVIRKALIQDNRLEQVPGAAGQDTLFSWQLLQCAQRISTMDLPVYNDYVQAAGAAPQRVTAEFFQKLLLLQQPKADWLAESGLIDAFMEQRYDNYTTNWVLKKLSLAAPEDGAECAALVEQMLAPFAPYYRHTDPVIDRFLELCEQKDYAGAAASVREKFPVRAVRPMRTLEELLNGTQNTAKLLIECAGSGGAWTFYNCTKELVDPTYAWVIQQVNTGGNQKIHQSKYTDAPEFTYDFSRLGAGVYRVRAFVKCGAGEKLAEDAAFLRVDERGKTAFLELESRAILRK
jgi:spore maturation protein CgeB